MKGVSRSRLLFLFVVFYKGEFYFLYPNTWLFCISNDRLILLYASALGSQKEITHTKKLNRRGIQSVLLLFYFPFIFFDDAAVSRGENEYSYVPMRKLKSIGE